MRSRPVRRSSKNVREPADDAFAPDLVGEYVLVIDSVLQGDHGRILAEQRFHLPGGRAGVEGFDTQQNEIARPDVLGIVRGREIDAEIAVDALDVESPRLERFEVLTARDQVNVRAGSGQPSSEVRADATGAVDCDFHTGIRDRTTILAYLLIPGRENDHRSRSEITSPSPSTGRSGSISSIEPGSPNW